MSTFIYKLIFFSTKKLKSHTVTFVTQINYPGTVYFYASDIPIGT